MPIRTKAETKTIIAAAKRMKRARYVLRLYIAGLGPRSSEAIRRVTAFCEEYLTNRYELEIVDIYQKPELMRGEQIIAVPTLVKHLPVPLRRFIGSIDNEEKLLSGLDLQPLARSAQP
jgi:circadian clock protein KaiB